MGTAPETKLIVKHTFLEFVHDRPLHKGLRIRSQTDSALVCGLSDQDTLSVDSPRTSIEDETSSFEHCSSSSEFLDVRHEVPFFEVQAATRDSPKYQLAPCLPEAVVPWGVCYDASGWDCGAGWWMPTSYITDVQTGGTLVPHDEQQPDSWGVWHSNCPQASSSGGSLGTTQSNTGTSEDAQTTLMLRNLPNNYTRGMLLELIDAEGFAGTYDFVYLPIDFNSQAGLGYAFVNLLSPIAAQRFWKHFDGFARWALPSEKVCLLNWSSPHQGLAAHIERYRNSPVMHEAVPDQCKPMIFADAVRIPFPPPTKQLKAPRNRLRDPAKAR